MHKTLLHGLILGVTFWVAGAVSNYLWTALELGPHEGLTAGVVLGASLSLCLALGNLIRNVMFVPWQRKNILDSIFFVLVCFSSFAFLSFAVPLNTGIPHPTMWQTWTGAFIGFVLIGLLYAVAMSALKPKEIPPQDL